MVTVFFDTLLVRAIVGGAKFYFPITELVCRRLMKLRELLFRPKCG